MAEWAKELNDLGSFSADIHIIYYIINKIHLNKKTMIIVPVKEGENIERALKKFKRKTEKTGVIKEVRKRREFEKPSVAKRKQMQHAIYVNQLHQQED